MSEGLDLVVEGAAERVTEDHALRRLAERWACKYDWRFEVHDGAFRDSSAPRRRTSSRCGRRPSSPMGGARTTPRPGGGSAAG
ncbi:hypothetical protein NKG05_24565 [Oerskovia sp. M15]